MKIMKMTCEFFVARVVKQDGTEVDTVLAFDLLNDNKFRRKLIMTVFFRIFAAYLN